MAVRKHSSVIWQIFILAITISLWSPDLSSGILSQGYAGPSNGKQNPRRCDPAIPLTAQEQEELMGTLRQTTKGSQLLADYLKVYNSLSTLVIQWDSVSYSQISRPEFELENNLEQTKNKGRSLASDNSSNELRPEQQAVVCIHLSKRLPEIEHVADLAHELTHATRLTAEVLKGKGMQVDEFVKARIAASGGEADAFAVECAVKREILGHWDGFCAPYLGRDDSIDVAEVVKDLYSGSLAASLTGEAYPIMLAKQFKRMNERQSVNGVRK